MSQTTFGSPFSSPYRGDNAVPSEKYYALLFDTKRTINTLDKQLVIKNLQIKALRREVHRINRNIHINSFIIGAVMCGIGNVLLYLLLS
jgi:hypothetical protein